MVKGIQRRLFVVKTPENTCFEEAYFILRPEEGEEHPPGRLSEEAARVIGEGQTVHAGPGRVPWAWFFAGALTGTFAAAVIFLLFLAF